MAKIAEFKVAVVDLDDKVRSLEKKLAMIIKDHEELVKDRGSQKSLDFHTQDLSFTECCVYYESLKDTHDVYMIPYQRTLNPWYKYLHSSDDNSAASNWTTHGMPGRYSYDGFDPNYYDNYRARSTIKSEPNVYYGSSITKWRSTQDSLEKYKKDNLYWEYNPLYNNNPDNQYAYRRVGFYFDPKRNPWKTIYGIDMKRIYTKETWDLTFPEEVQSLFAAADDLIHYYEAEKKAESEMPTFDQTRLTKLKNTELHQDLLYLSHHGQIMRLAEEKFLNHLIQKNYRTK